VAEMEQLRLFGKDNEDTRKLEQHTPSHPRPRPDEPPTNRTLPPWSQASGGGAPTKPMQAEQTAGLWEIGTPRRDLTNLDAIAQEVAGCRLCKLGHTRTNAVPGEGNPQARIMFVGEGPGAEEDAQGRPFVGSAGKLLDKLIVSMDLKREDVFIGNVVKCRPPRNRDPEPGEVKACMPYLARQIDIIRPDVLVILGATALRALIDPKARITRVRGDWLERSGIMVMPTFHPAALLRDPSKKLLVWEDMKKVLSFLDETN